MGGSNSAIVNFWFLQLFSKASQYELLGMNSFIVKVFGWSFLSPKPQYSDITSSFLFNVEAKETIANESN